MLKGIDEIPWHLINHAYGTCESVPEMLHELAEGSDQAPRVLGWLEGCCFHQETHYDANAHILPFLLEIVSSPVAPGREQIFPTLIEWFWGIEVLEPPRSPAQWQSFWVSFDKDCGIRGIHSADHWRRLKQKTMRAAWEHRERLLAMLADPVPGVRVMGATLLGLLVHFGHHCGGSWCEDRRCSWVIDAEVGKAARRLAEATRDESPAVRVAAIFSLGVMRDDAAAVQCSIAAWNAAPTPQDRTAAAAACLVGPDPPAAAMAEALIDGLSHDVLCDQSLAEVPWLRDRFADQLERSDVFDRLLAWLKASPHPLDDVIALLHARLVDGDATRRRAAAFVLARLPGIAAESRALLESALQDSDPLVRVRAAVGLWSPRNYTDARKFVEAFRPALASRDRDVRRQALEDMGQMWTELYPEADEYLTEEQIEEKYGESDRTVDGYPHWLTIRALPMAVPLLVETAGDESDLELQRLYCELFHRVGHECEQIQTGARAAPPAAEELSELLFRWAQDGHLGKMASKASFQQTPEQKAALVECWTRLIDDGHPNRAALVDAMGWLKQPQSLGTLVRLMAHDADEHVRARAAYHIRWLDEEQTALPLMLAHLASGTWELARQVCHYVSITRHGIDDENAADTLLGAFLDDVHAKDGKRLRSILIEALGAFEVRTAEIAGALHHVALTDEDPRIAHGAAKALGPLVGELTRAEVDQLLAADTVQAVLGLLDFFDHHAALPDPLADAFESILDHQHHRVRRGAIRALRDAEETPRRQRLISASLRDPHPDVQTAALWFDYKDLDRDDYIPPILDMLARDGADWVAWSRLSRIASFDDQLEGARLALRGGDAELLQRVCEWIEERGVTDNALEEAILHRLDDASLFVVSHLDLLSALVTVSPAKALERSALLDEIQSHPMQSIAERAKEIHQRCRG